jgi:hypothetical protein
MGRCFDDTARKQDDHFDLLKSVVSARSRRKLARRP